jgi:hypothetical protein
MLDVGPLLVATEQKRAAPGYKRGGPELNFLLLSIAG